MKIISDAHIGQLIQVKFYGDFRSDSKNINAAYKEALQLKKMKHPNLPIFQKVFLEKEKLCIVVDNI